MRTLLIGLAVAALMGAASAPPAAAAGVPPVATDAQLSCADGGGAYITYRISNLGREKITLLGVAFTANLVVAGGFAENPPFAIADPHGGVVVIPPGEEWSVTVDLGVSPVPDEPGLDFSANSILLHVDAELNEVNNYVGRWFAFPGCNGYL